MKKSFLSVNYMLVIAIIIIIVIGIISTFFLFFPWLERGFSCIQLQRENIYELTNTIEEVLLSGEERVVRFRVEECTKCIWYNHTGETDDPPLIQLEVEYESSNASFIIPSIPSWEGDIDESNTKDAPTCLPKNLVGTEGSKACDIHVTVNHVDVKC